MYINHILYVCANLCELHVLILIAYSLTQEGIHNAQASDPESLSQDNNDFLDKP